MVALWDECTNWRILQASAHCDIEASIEVDGPEQQSLFEIDPRPADIFDFCKTHGNNKGNPGNFTLGVVLETVRTFLSEWLSSGPVAVDWEPLIPDESFEFPVTEHFTKWDMDIDFNNNRRVWDCQRALQNELANTSAMYSNLPSSMTLITLFILSLPSIRIEEKEEEEMYDETRGHTDNGESSSTLVREHSSVNVAIQCLLPLTLR